MVKVGMIGTGFIGGVHYSAYCKTQGAKVVAICDLDKGKVENLIKGKASGGNISVESANPLSFDPGEIKIYTDIGKILKDPDVEMVDICLPTYMHKDAVIKVVKTGKHVLCEKPMSLNLKEADEMIKVTKKEKVKFMIAHVIRFWPEYVVLKEIIQKKSLGKLLYASFMRHSATPVWTWNNWILDTKKSLSAAVDLHIHDTDYILYICGMPKKVMSLGATKVTKGIDQIMTEYIYGNGAKLYAEGGWAFPPNYPFRMAFWSMFEKGAVEYNSMNVPLTVYENGKDPVQPKLPEGDGYLREIQYFLKCVEENKYPSIVTPEDARDALAIALCELKSVETGNPVVI